MMMRDGTRRWRRSIATSVAAALVGGGGLLALTGGIVVASSSLAHAATTFTVTRLDDPATIAGSNSLRDILENQVSNGDTVVLQAGATYTLNRPNGSGGCDDVELDVSSSITIQGNGATLKQTCTSATTASVIEMFGGASLTLNGTTITGGSTQSGNNGGGIQDDQVSGGALTINGSAIIGNSASCEGGGIYHGATNSATTIINSTIANNTAGTFGGGVKVDQETSKLTVVDSTISNNTGHPVGGIDSAAPTTIVYTTFVNNTTGTPGACAAAASAPADTDRKPGTQAQHPVRAAAPAAIFAANLQLEFPPAAVAVLPAFNVFGTVIALPTGGLNCGGNNQPLSATISAGFNYSDDASCGLTAGTDKQNGSNPNLAALAANGGVGPTRLPQTGSPLIDAIPVANCGGGNGLAGFAVTTDERGITRPQGAGCEIGAVEVVPVTPIVVAPRFTG